MIVFWLIIFFMTLLALVFVIVPLIKPSQVKAPSLKKLQVAIYQEKLTVLEAQRATGALSPADFDQEKDQLDRAAIENIDKNQAMTNRKPAWVTAMIILILLPVIAIALYQHWGAYEKLKNYEEMQNRLSTLNQVLATGNKAQTLIHLLKNRLKQDPDSAQGWYLLAKIYLSENQFQPAADAFTNASKLKPDNMELVIARAQALYFASGKKMTAEVKNLIDQVLKQQPNNPNALNLLAVNAYMQKDYQTALDDWQKILLLLPPDSAQRTEVIKMMNDARAKITSPIKPLKLAVEVTLAKPFQAKFAPNTALFVFAKAVNGPDFPLAVIKKTVADLPLRVTLTDADAMLPDVKLEDFKQIQIIARISPNGTPMMQAGDLQGESKILNTDRLPQVILVAIDHLKT